MKIAAAESRDWRGIAAGCLIICLLGAAFRWPMFNQGGHESDLGFFAEWANTIHKYGVVDVYLKSQIKTNYPVGFMYILSVFDECARGFDPSIKQWTVGSFERPFKILLCVCDIAITVCLIFGGLTLGASSRNALLAGASYMLNPAVMMITALWGQTNAMAIGIMLAAFVFVCLRFWPLAYVLAALACNTKLQVVPLLPLIPLATAYVQSAGEKKLYVKRIAVGAGLFLLTTLLLFVPFLVAGTIGKALSAGYSSHFETDPALNRNAWNIWSVCTFPEQHISSVPPVLVQIGNRVPWLASAMNFFTYFRISVLLFGITSLAMYLCVVRQRSRKSLFFAAAGILVAFFLLMTKIHERYLLDAIPVLLFAAALEPSAFGLCAIVSLISALNVHWFIDLLVPVSVFILGLVLVRILLVILAPDAEAAWLWEIGLARKRWFDKSTVTYIVACVAGAAFLCPWSLWLANLTRPAVIYFDELQLLYYHSDVYSPLYPNHSSKGEPVVAGGVRYERSLEFPVNGMASFAVPPGYGTFCCGTGISDSASKNASDGVIFIVSLDNRPVFRSDVIYPSTASREITIPLGKAKEIELIAIDAAQKDKTQHKTFPVDAVWTNARLELGNIRF